MLSDDVFEPSTALTGAASFTWWKISALTFMSSGADSIT